MYNMSVHMHIKEMNGMPRNDRTGPRGDGPMTGRKLGFCREEETNEQPTSRLGLNRRNAIGRGRGGRRSNGFRNNTNT